MKSCEYWQSLIEEYLDGGLAEDEKQSFLTHISSCSECGEALKLAKAVRAALSELPAIEVPDDFMSSLHERIEKEHAKRRAVITYSRRCAMLAACVVIAVAVNAGSLKDFLGKNDSELAPELGPEITGYSTMYNDAAANDEAAAAHEETERTGEEVKSTPTNEKNINNIKQSNEKSTAVKKTESVKAAPSPVPEHQYTSSKVQAEDTRVTEDTAAVQGGMAENASKQNADGAAETAAETQDNGIAVFGMSEELSGSAKKSADIENADNSVGSDSAEAYPMLASGIPPETDKGYGGSASAAGSSGGASVRAASSAVGTVRVDNAEKAAAIAAEYTSDTGGIYKMSESDFGQFCEELTENDISYSDEAVHDEAVCFRIIEY